MPLLPCRSLLVLALVSLPSGAGPAQDEAELRARYVAKLGGEFVKAVPWIHSYGEAREKARKYGKLVLVYFTRSDEPCPPCGSLESQLLLEEWWRDAAKKHVPYLHVTTGVASMDDEGLFEEKGGTKLPGFAFIDPATGAVLARLTDRQRQSQDFEAAASLAKEEAAELKQLASAARARSSDAKLQARLKLELAMMYADGTALRELPELARTEGLDPATKAAFESWYPARRVHLAQREVAAKLRTSSEEERDLLAVAYYGLLQEGVRLPADARDATEYYLWGMLGAVRAGDRATAEAAYAGYAAGFEGAAFDGIREGMLARARKLLDELDRPAPSPGAPGG